MKLDKTMVQALPQSIASKLIDECNNLGMSIHRYIDLDKVNAEAREYFRLKEEAEKLTSNKEFAFAGYALLGFLSVFIGSKNSVSENFGNAIRMSLGNDTYAKENFAKSLSILGYYSEAQKLLLDIINRENIHKFRGIAQAWGAFNFIKENYGDIRTTSPDFQKESPEIKKKLDDINQHIWTQIIPPDTDITALLDKAGEVIREHKYIKIEVMRLSDKLDLDLGKPRCLHYFIDLDLPANEVGQANNELADLIAQSDIEIPMTFHVSFRKKRNEH